MSLTLRSTLPRVFTVLLTVAAIHIPLQAQNTYFQEYDKNIAKLGVQGTAYYVTFAEPFGQTCMYGPAYIAADKKGLYAHLLAAKLAGKRISRFDYSQPAGNGGQCWVELVEFAN